MFTNTISKAISESEDTSLTATISKTDAVISHLRGMTGTAVAAKARELFGDNLHQRILFHCYIRTLQNCEDMTINPRYYVPNLIGAPGFGKSGLTYEFATVMTEYLSNLAGERVSFKVLVRTLAGINDFGDILGIQNTDFEQGVTRLFPPASFPRTGDGTFGFVFIDDFNRGHDHVIAAAMEFVNTGSYNDYKLPTGWSMVAASNPQGGKHKVKSIDEAQATRFVNLPYTPPRMQFIKQLAKQGVENDILAYFMRFKEVAEVPSMTNVLPEPRPINWRNSTIFAHLYPSIRHDDSILNEVAYSIFGPNAIRDLQSILKDEMPLSPDEILGGTAEQRVNNDELKTPKAAWEYTSKKLKLFLEMRRTDIITVTGHRLVTYVNKSDVNLSPEQFDNLAQFLMEAPKEIALDCMRQLVEPSAPKNRHYRPLFTTWGSTDGKSAGILAKRFFEVSLEIQNKVKAVHEKNARKSEAN